MIDTSVADVSVGPRKRIRGKTVADVGLGIEAHAVPVSKKAKAVDQDPTDAELLAACRAVEEQQQKVGKKTMVKRTPLAMKKASKQAKVKRTPQEKMAAELQKRLEKPAPFGRCGRRECCAALILKP